MRAELLHKIRGYIIGRVSKTPFEGNRLAYSFIFVGGAGCPFGAVGGEKTLRHANSLVAGAHTLLHCESIEEGLYGRAHLAFALRNIVVFEPAVIGSADIGLDMAGYRLHRHKTAAEHTLVIANAVIRSHGGIGISLAVCRQHPTWRVCEIEPKFASGTR